MYEKYQTEALILGGRNIGEADKILTLYTRDFGLVRARVSAIRAEGSRMRYALQNFSRVQVALVRGARGWRVAGALPNGAPVQTSLLGVPTFARIAHLTMRLSGEEKNDYLFEALSGAHAALARVSADEHATVELMCVARILYALGYISKEALDLSAPREIALFTHATYVSEYLKNAEELRDKLLPTINRAIAETHL